MTDLHVYLAILKASYDYDPQSDDELAIKENQLLFLLDKVDDDWWKVKVKLDSTDDDGPSGLVPAAYVEPADHVSVVKVLYDYDASSSGELSVKEDEILLVYETDQDWLLVQSQTEGGKAGYVPGNYVEATSEEEEESAPVATTPKAARPVSTYVDPADRVASSKTTQPNTDAIKTWPVTDIDKKGKKKKGTLGIGNGAIFFASESDKTPVQKWPTSDVVDVVVEKGKQIRIDVGGANLHYNTGSKENAEAILEKIQSSKSQSNSRVSQDVPVDGPSASSTGRKVGKKASVHFSQSDPVIIPPRDEEEEEDQDLTDEQQEDNEEHEESQENAVALYDFTADGDDELSIKEGDQLVILEKDGDEWWKCRNSSGEEGVVPASYLEVPAAAPRMYSPPLPARSNANAEKERAEAAAKAAREAEERAESARRQREEEQALARKKQESQRAKELAAEVEKRKREEETARSSSPALAPEPKKSTEDGRSSAELKRPPSDKVRTWHDRTGQFRVDAAFLGVSNGKIRLHKVNGVTVEVPTEKMSFDDMRYVEKLTKKPSKSSQKVSDDDVPLPLLRSQRNSASKKPNFDWFDFFLSAGCDVDDCTRYATSFEKDKVDETILPDITESTMRTLGLREGDIIRVSKAIEKRKSNGKKTSPLVEAQIRSDEELARQIQALETAGGSPRGPAPNLFAGPGGVLKAPRRRPQPTKSLPPSVDIKAIKPVSSPSDQSTGSQPTSSSSTPVQPPARSSSAAPVVNQFDDDAWTNRPSSAKPATSTPPSAAPRSSPAPAPPASAPLIPTGPTIAQAASPMPPPQANNVNPPANNMPSMTQPAQAPSLAKTTESDVFDQLARLSDLRKPATPPSGRSSASPFINAPPPASYPAGLGMGSSPLPIGQHLQGQAIQNQQPVIVPSPSPQIQIQPQAYNGPRGPFAPVPVNQSLLQPLIPAQNTFNGFVPTRPLSNTNATMPSLQAAPQPSFLAAQPTGLPNQMMLPQAAGAPFGGFSSTAPTPMTMQSTGAFGPMPPPLQSQFTGFNPGAGQLSNNFMAPPPVPPLPSAASSAKDTSPANVFAQMKSGTFANEDESQPQSSERYDALRPAPLLVQQTGWGQPYQGGFIGYPR